MTLIKKKITNHFGLDTDPLIACSCCDAILHTRLFYDTMTRVEYLRIKCGFPITFNSGHRCKKHNRIVGGGKNSWHLRFAGDLRASDGEPEKLDIMWEFAIELGFSGMGRYDTFNHLDLRQRPYTWDNR